MKRKNGYGDGTGKTSWGARWEVDEAQRRSADDRAVVYANNNNRVYDLKVEQNKLDQRRLDLDLQKFELKKSERKAQVEQSKKLKTLIAKLVNKLK